MRIRNIQPSDREFFIQSVDEFYHTPAVCHSIPKEHSERTFECLLTGSPYTDCLIAEDDEGVPVGYCLLALTWSNEGGGLCVWLDELMVSGTHRDKGIGRSLISAAKEKYAGAARFRLEVTEENRRAADLYQRLGFVKLPYCQMIIDTD